MERSEIHKKTVEEISEILFKAKITATEAYGILETIKHGIQAQELLKMIKKK